MGKTRVSTALVDVVSGSCTGTPLTIDGRTIMKMIRSTRQTSTRGVTLMSELRVAAREMRMLSSCFVGHHACGARNRIGNAGCQPAGPPAAGRRRRAVGGPAGSQPALLLHRVCDHPRERF